MNLIVWIGIGIVIGWAATLLIASREDDTSVVLSIVAGTFGATFAALAVSRFGGNISFGFGTDFSVPASLAALAGALVGVGLLRLLIPTPRTHAKLPEPAAVEPSTAAAPAELRPSEPGMFDSANRREPQASVRSAD
jgi:uncharacterized membrane protein YeaQ/YmgE (transglycosylase-associated protein family)